MHARQLSTLPQGSNVHAWHVLNSSFVVKCWKRNRLSACMLQNAGGVQLTLREECQPSMWLVVLMEHPTRVRKICTTMPAALSRSHIVSECSITGGLVCNN